MIYHFVVGDAAAGPLQEAILAEPSMAGEVVVLRDVLSVGPLQKAEGQSFSELRSAFWQEVSGNDKQPVAVDDMERLLEVSKAMYASETIAAWCWMATIPADVSAYYWLLPYLSKHAGRFYLINIAGLPFLDEQGKVFYPKSFAQVLPRELIKARKLARPVTPAEVEVDMEEWRKILEANSGIRTAEGGKKLAAREESHYDNLLLSFCTQQYQKASKIITQALTKHGIPTGDMYLGWRLRQMAAAGRLQLQGDVTKALKDFEVKLPGGTASDTTAETAGAITTAS
jgi:hypothetical protein